MRSSSSTATRARAWTGTIWSRGRASSPAPSRSTRPGSGKRTNPGRSTQRCPATPRSSGARSRSSGIDRAHLVVHDFGAPWGFTWGASHPDAFASVVIVNGAPVSGYRWYVLAKIWRTPVAGELLHWTLTPPTFRWLMRRGNPKGLPDEAVERMRRHYDRGTQRTVLRLYRATEAAHMVPAPVSLFADLDRPALVVWGAQDIYIPNRYVDEHRLAFPMRGSSTCPAAAISRSWTTQKVLLRM